MNLGVHERDIVTDHGGRWAWGAEVERRDIEIFLALGEELHFGRTADRLHVSPTMISKTIKKLERIVGAKLFDCTSRRVDLTPIGRQLSLVVCHTVCGGPRLFEVVFGPVPEGVGG